MTEKRHEFKPLRCLMKLLSDRAELGDVHQMKIKPRCLHFTEPVTFQRYSSHKNVLFNSQKEKKLFHFSNQSNDLENMFHHRQ